MRLKIKVIPGASRNQVSGWWGDRLKIRVQAPPESGKANKAVINVIEKSFVLLKGTVQIESGFTSSKKVITISGYTDHEITAKLNAVI